MRFHSAPVVRLSDAKPMHLGHTVKADGRWRLFAFADASDPAEHYKAQWTNEISHDDQSCKSVIEKEGMFEASVVK